MIPSVSTFTRLSIRATLNVGQYLIVDATLVTRTLAAPRFFSAATDQAYRSCHFTPFGRLWRYTAIHIVHADIVR